MKIEDELLLVGLTMSEVVFSMLAQVNADRLRVQLDVEALSPEDIELCWEQARETLTLTLRKCLGPKRELADSRVLRAMIDRLGAPQASAKALLN